MGCLPHPVMSRLAILSKRNRLSESNFRGVRHVDVLNGELIPVGDKLMDFQKLIR